MKQLKENKKSIMKRVMLIMSTVVLFITTVFGSGILKAQAASKKQNAKTMKIYRHILEGGYLTSMHVKSDGYGMEFLLYDVNNDKKKELIISYYSESQLHCIGVYAVNGKYLGNIPNYSLEGVSKKGVKGEVGPCGYCETIYRVTKKGVKIVAEAYERGGNPDDIAYCVGEKEVTEAEFRKVEKKYKFKSPKFHTATKKNMDKYLK